MNSTLLKIIALLVVFFKTRAFTVDDKMIQGTNNTAIRWIQ